MLDDIALWWALPTANHPKRCIKAHIICPHPIEEEMGWADAWQCFWFGRMFVLNFYLYQFVSYLLLKLSPKWTLSTAWKGANLPYGLVKLHMTIQSYWLIEKWNKSMLISLVIPLTQSNPITYNIIKLCTVMLFY